MTRTDRVFRATALVTVIIVFSKLCGFARDMITANYFGTGLQNDAYVASYSLFYLPILLFNSCITSTLIPLFMQARKQNGLKAASRFGSNAMNIFTVASVIVSFLMYAFAQPLVRFVFHGFDAEKTALTVKLARIMLLSLSFNVISIVMSSLLNAREKYVAAQLTGFPLSFAVITAAVFFSKKYGIDAIAWGVFASGILQVLIQVPFLAGWFHYSPRIDFTDPQFQRLLVLAVPAILSMAVSEVNHMVDNSFASMLGEGALSTISYAFRLITFISGVLVVPITTVMFSKVSKLVVLNNRAGIIDLVKRCIEVISLIVVPITAISLVTSRDIIRFAYQRGQFGESSVAMTAGAFLFFVIGVLFFGLRDLLSRAFHSMQDTRTPFFVTLGGLSLNVLLDLVLSKLFGVNGIALASTTVGMTSMVVMFVLFRRRMGQLGLKSLAQEIAKIFIAGIACFAVSAVMNLWLPQMRGTLRVFMRLAAVSIPSGLAYILTLLALREKQLMTFISALNERGR